MAYIDLNSPFMAKLRRRLEPYVEAVAVDLRNEIVNQMDPGPPRTGRGYPVPGTMSDRDRAPTSGPRPTYTASAPGEPPAVATGAYVGAWQSTPGVSRGSQVVAYATNDRKTADGKHFVGEILEYGTEDGRIAPRPHIRPALEIVAERHGGRVVG